MATKVMTKRRGKPDQPKPASQEEAPDRPEPDEPEANGAALAAPKAEAGASERPAVRETARDLRRINKELQVRIRELEGELVGGTQVGEGVATDEVSDESSSIIAMVKDLHGEIDAAYELKEALEADLAAMKDGLDEEQAVRAELETRLNLLEAKAALGDQLREDISFVEEERNETARRLDAATSELAEVTGERDGLAQQKAIDEARVRQIETDKVSLEAKVLNLEEKVAEMRELRKELAEASERSQALEENVQDLEGKLEATETSRNALELDLTTTRELVRSQGDQIDELKDVLATTQSELADVHAKLEKQELENMKLLDSNKRSERETKTLTTQNESLKKDLDLSKKALRDIRAAAVRTTGRVRERYSGA